MISHGYVRCTLDHWSVLNSSKYKNCLQRRSFSISPEAMLRFHFQVHENQANLWYFTNLPAVAPVRRWDSHPRFPWNKRSHFPSKKQPFLSFFKVSRLMAGKKHHPPCNQVTGIFPQCVTARDQVERVLRLASRFLCPNKKRQFARIR